MRAVSVAVCGRQLWLYLNGEAYLMLLERYGVDYLDKIFPDRVELDPESQRAHIGTILESAQILAEQGVLARNALGYPEEPVPDVMAFAHDPLFQPADLLHLRDALGMAISAGMSREYQPEADEERQDLVLLELQKKTKSP